jgi:hypothetical protein
MHLVQPKRTCFDAILQSLSAVAQNLLEVLRLIRDVEAMRHHFPESVRVVEVEHLAAAVVGPANVVE